MNMARREPRWAVAFTVLLALILQALPLPTWLEAVRPSFIGLVVVYWAIYAPHAGGIFAPWLAGLGSTSSRARCWDRTRWPLPGGLYRDEPAPAPAQPDADPAVAVRIRRADAERIRRLGHRRLERARRVPRPGAGSSR